MLAVFNATEQCRVSVKVSLAHVAVGAPHCPLALAEGCQHSALRTRHVVATMHLFTMFGVQCAHVPLQKNPVSRRGKRLITEPSQMCKRSLMQRYVYERYKPVGWSTLPYSSIIDVKLCPDKCARLNFVVCLNLSAPVRTQCAC